MSSDLTGGIEPMLRELKRMQQEALRQATDDIINFAAEALQDGIKHKDPAIQAEMLRHLALIKSSAEFISGHLQ